MFGLAVGALTARMASRKQIEIQAIRRWDVVQVEIRAERSGY